MSFATTLTLERAGLGRGLLVAGWLLLAGGAVAGWWRPRVDWVLMLFFSVVALVALNEWARWRRENLIREAPLPRFLHRRVR